MCRGYRICESLFSSMLILLLYRLNYAYNMIPYRPNSINNVRLFLKPKLIRFCSFHISTNSFHLNKNVFPQS